MSSAEHGGKVSSPVGQCLGAIKTRVWDQGWLDTRDLIYSVWGPLFILCLDLVLWGHTLSTPGLIESCQATLSTPGLIVSFGAALSISSLSWVDPNPNPKSTPLAYGVGAVVRILSVFNHIGPDKSQVRVSARPEEPWSIPALVSQTSAASIVGFVFCQGLETDTNADIACNPKQTRSTRTARTLRSTRTSWRT